VIENNSLFGFLFFLPPEERLLMTNNTEIKTVEEAIIAITKRINNRTLDYNFECLESGMKVIMEKAISHHDKDDENERYSATPNINVLIISSKLTVNDNNVNDTLEIYATSTKDSINGEDLFIFDYMMSAQLKNTIRQMFVAAIEATEISKAALSVINEILSAES
jgi:hypothetical protein